MMLSRRRSNPRPSRVKPKSTPGKHFLPKRKWLSWRMILHSYCCQDRGLGVPWADALARTDAPLPGFRWQRSERYYIGTSIHCHIDTTKAHAFQSELVARWYMALEARYSISFEQTIKTYVTMQPQSIDTLNMRTCLLASLRRSDVPCLLAIWVDYTVYSVRRVYIHPWGLRTLYWCPRSTVWSSHKFGGV